MKILINFFKKFTKKKTNALKHPGSVFIQGTVINRENPFERQGF